VRAFIDTNVVAYAFDLSEAAKRQRAMALLGSSEHRLVVSTQVLLECWWVLTRKLSRCLSEDEAHDVVRELSRLPVVQADAALVDQAIEASRRWGIAVWDGMIVEAARAGGCDCVLSEDLQAGQDFAGIVIENPFAELG
jgi:predicted nucleic acid-binding protein